MWNASTRFCKLAKAFSHQHIGFTLNEAIAHRLSLLGGCCIKTASMGQLHSLKKRVQPCWLFFSVAQLDSIRLVVFLYHTLAHSSICPDEERCICPDHTKLQLPR